MVVHFPIDALPGLLIFQKPTASTVTFRDGAPQATKAVLLNGCHPEQPWTYGCSDPVRLREPTPDVQASTPIY